MKAHLTALAACLLAVPIAAHAAATQYQAGQTDRAEWEAWFNGLSPGQYKGGAEWWAAQRSLPRPSTCEAGQPSFDFLAGCRAAKWRLDLSDSRRRTEPDYKLGWNAWTAETPAWRPPATDPIVPAYTPPASQLLTTTTTLERWGKGWSTLLLLNDRWQIAAVIDTGADISCLNKATLDDLYRAGSLTRADYVRTETIGTAGGV
jgi:hypothetical protein